MPAKKTKKSDLESSRKRTENQLKSGDALENDVKKSTEKITEKGTKKVIVKRRKADLKLTKASAVAIVSQANRAKKQALIEKVANSDVVPVEKPEKSDTKIPVWVWTFFGCSLLLFCVSFYHAIILPKIEKERIVVENTWIDDSNDAAMETQEVENKYDVVGETADLNEIDVEQNQGEKVLESATDVIEEFFARLSGRDFDGAFDLMTPALRGYSDIRTHFSSFRMDPFLDGVDGGKIVPKNIQYKNSPAYGKDVYSFDLSYIMKSDQEKFDETWEFGVNSSSGEPKISSIRCVSSKCSFHPIFWPENFGLMR